MCIGQGLAGADDGGQIAFHQLCTLMSAKYVHLNLCGLRTRTLVKVGFIEVLRAWNVHIVQAGNLFSAYVSQILL